MVNQPNILILHADQLRYDCLGCNGNPYVRTPNLDRLAAEGTRFTRHISSNTICMPSRAGLFTGLYPPGHNVWTNGIALNRFEYANVNTEVLGERLHLDPPTAADIFADAGYDTASFGKLHLTPNLAPKEFGFPETWACWEDGRFDDWHGPYYGFQHVEMTQGHGEHPCRQGHYGLWLQQMHPEISEARDRNAREAERPVPQLRDLYASAVPAEMHNTTWLADRFAAYLDAVSGERPFFAFVGFPDPHHPFTPSYDIVRDFESVDVHAPFDPHGEALAGTPLLDAGTDVSALTPEERRIVMRYTYAMIFQIDQAVGRIVDSLKRAGVWDNTIIVFTSDHGDFLCDHARLRKSINASDPLLHLPFIMRVPNAVCVPGAMWPEQVATPMSNVDVLPTLAALAGVPGPAWVHGVDMAQVVREGQEHVALSYCSGGHPETVNYTVYDDVYRFTVYPHTGYAELYNHCEDPGETRNLVEVEAQRAADMRRVIESRLLMHRNPILSRVCAW